MFELLRRFIRGILGYRSPIYQRGAILLNKAMVLQKEGRETLDRIERIENDPSGRDEVVHLRSLDHPITVRCGTNDLVTAVDTVVREEYGEHLPKPPIRVLIDAGAFIGDTSAWFLTSFPEIEVWAMEPFPDNYRLAQINLAPYGERAHVLDEALAGSTGTMRFEGDGTGGGVDASSSDGLEVKTISVPDLLARVPHERIDILKLDIEGAELDIFESEPERWLDRVDLIIVELHGPEIERKVHAILDRNGWSYKQFRSVFYCRKKGR